MKKIIVYALLLTTLIQCKKKEETELIKVKKQYSIEIPKSLTKVEFLHADASLQYQNMENEFYTIVIDEPSVDFENLILEDADLRATYSPDLAGYTQLLQTNIALTLKEGQFSAIEDIKINGLNAKRIDASGKIDDIAVYYQLTFIKGKETYYQIVSWTELKRKNNHEETMADIVSSFKEISKTKK